MARREQPDPGLLNQAWDTTKSGAYKTFETINKPNEWILQQTVTPQQWKALKARNNGGIVDSRDVMQMKGIMGPKDTWLNFGGGLVADTVGDYLNWVPIMRPMGAAYDMARSTIGPKGITNSLVEGAFKKVPSIEKASKPIMGQPLGAAVRRDMMNRGVDPANASKADILGKASSKGGLAKRYGNLQQILDAADAGVQIPGLNTLRQRLKVLRESDPAKFAKIMQQPLQTDLGLNLPGVLFFKEPTALASFGAGQSSKSAIPGMGAVYKAANTGAQIVGDIGSATRQGIPNVLRKASIPNALARVFDSKVGATLDEGDQIVTKSLTEAGQAGGALGRRKGATATSLLRTADDAAEVLSEKGSRALGDKIEKPLDMFDSAIGQVRPRTADELAQGFGNNFGMSGPVARNMDSFVKWWDDVRTEGLLQDKNLGVSANPLDDNRLGGYLSRSLNPNQAKQINSGVQNVAGNPIPANQPFDSSMLERSMGTKIPGGRDTLSFQLAQDPFLVGPKRLAPTDEAASKRILDTVFPNVTDKMAKRKSDELANILKRMPDVVDNNGKMLAKQPSPLYGQHPTESIMKYLENRGQARGVADAQLDHIAGRAIKGKDYADLNEYNKSGKSVTMSNALENIGLNKNAHGELRRKIAQYKNVDASQVQLNDYFLPGDSMRSLQVPAQVYDKVTGLNSLEGIINWVQATWRNSILLWPARYVRDKVGGLIVNMYEGWFNPFDEKTAMRIVAYGAYDDAVQASLMKFPRYAGLDANAASDMFYADLMEANITSFGQRLDHGVAGAAVQDKFIGINKGGKGTLRQVVDGYSEAMQDIGGMLSREGQYAEAGAKVGDIVDTSNRLSAFVHLLRKGNSPEIAAQEIKRAHVDYSSLSDVEAKFRDVAMPFYTYMSRMLLEQGGRTIRNPGRTQGFLRPYTASEREDYNHQKAAPDYLRERGAATNPVMKDNYVYGLDVPGFEQAGLLYNLAQVPFALTHTDSAAAAGQAYDQAVSSLSPAAKMIGQFATGRISDGLQQGIPFGQKQGTLFRGLRDAAQLTGQEPLRNSLTMRLADEALSVSPLPRSMNLARQLLQNAKAPTVGGVANTASTNLVGLRNVKVDEQARIRARLEGITRSVSAGAQGYERTFENSYIPQDAMSALQANDPKTARRYEVQQTLRSQQKKIYEAKESGRVPTGMRNRN